MLNTPEYFMQQALKLSLKARLIAPPNPWVGAVIVKNNTIIGQGHTQVPGHNHAEIEAINDCSSDPRGSTCYVTLEPCSHYGKTPPCVNALIKAGISKCVIAMVDPDNKVSGSGINVLKNAGIEVEIGLLEKEATAILQPYITHRSLNRPYIILKYAQSLDGKIAAHDYSSQWISCPKARERVHLDRSQSQAILVGANTIRKDNPSLIPRSQDLPKYSVKRVVLTDSNNLPNTSKIFQNTTQPTIIYTTNPKVKTNYPDYIQLVSLSPSENVLQDLFKSLASLGVLQVYIEGGSKIISQCIQNKLFDRLDIYTGPLIIGSSGIPSLSASLCGNIDTASRVKLTACEVYDNTVLTQYTLQ